MSLCGVSHDGLCVLEERVAVIDLSGELSVSMDEILDRIAWMQAFKLSYNL